MINVDLTKVFHPKVADLLAPFLPGLFFVMSVLLANPLYAQRMVRATSADRYIQLFVVVFAAFVVGSALLQWVRFMQIKFSRLCARLLRWEPKIREWRVQRLQAQMQREQPGQPRQTPQGPSKAGLKLQAVFNRQVEYEEALKNAQTAWEEAATQLLKRYGIEVTPRDWHWEPWVNTLGEVPPADWRGTLLVIALHATGWSGLLALLFAPDLRTWSFTIFCLFLIGYGVLHDWEVARNFSNPVSQWTILLRCVVAELKKSGGSNSSEPESTKPSET